MAFSPLDIIPPPGVEVNLLAKGIEPPSRLGFGPCHLISYHTTFAPSPFSLEKLHVHVRVEQFLNEGLPNETMCVLISLKQTRSFR